MNRLIRRGMVALCALTASPGSRLQSLPQARASARPWRRVDGDHASAKEASNSNWDGSSLSTSNFASARLGRRMRGRSVRPALIAVACLLFASCSYLKPLHGVPTQHIVMVDSNGRLMDPTGTSNCQEANIQKDNENWVLAHKTVRPPETYRWKPCNGHLNPLKSFRELDRREESGSTFRGGDLYLDDLFDEMEKHYSTKRASDIAAGRPPSRKRRIVLYIHGGLNNNMTTIDRARDLSQLMLDDGYYPIFMNWQSNLIGSLWEHLMTVRQGEYKGYKHAFLFPFYLGADLSKGIARAPATWFYQGSHTLDRIRQVRCNATPWEFDDAYNRLRKNFVTNCSSSPESCGQLAVSRGPEVYTQGEQFKAASRFTATGAVPSRYWVSTLAGGWAQPIGWLPPKLLTSPVLDGLGGPAWETMLRHAALGFHSDGVSNPAERPRQSDPEGNGGFSRFLRRLQTNIGDTSCGAGTSGDCVEWELTVIGHSMGAIVANHMLNEFPDLSFTNIVYMASAASVRDYERAVFPYLVRHPESRMYHLTLHNFSDLRDQYFYDVPPAGSLLVWIDSFLSKPETLRDRTAGRFNNLMLFAEETPEPLRARISMKAFGVGADVADSDPQHHGGFALFNGVDNRPKFWDPSFWKVEMVDRPSPRSDCARNRSN